MDLSDSSQLFEGEFDFKIAMEFRHGWDPFLSLLELTNFTMAFGETAGNFTYLGWMLLIICLGLTVQPMFYVSKRIKYIYLRAKYS